MATSSAAATAELLTRFRRQRPLRGGSLLVTIFGDSLQPRGGAISLGSLIALAAPFGLNERLVRTACARLAKDGWLEGRREGKLSEYRLAADGRERFADATLRIYGAPPPWSGRWTLIVVPALRAARRPLPPAARKTLRDALIWQGCGELSPGVFAHPQLDPAALRQRLRPPDLLANAVIFEADLTAAEAPQRLVTLGWDLDDLSTRYQRFVKRFERVQRVLNDHGALDAQGSFIVRTLLIHEYRRLHLRDPLLPPGLLRASWPGTQAAALCRDIYSRVVARSESHLSHVATRLGGPLPAADAALLQRFGGIAPT